MSKINHIFKLIKKNKVWSIVLGVMLVGGIALFGSSGGEAKETVSPVQEDLVRTVKISGKVTSREKVELGFEVAGTISSVGKAVGSRVSRGEVLARVGSGAISAEIQKAEAELASAQAELNKLEGTQVYENSITNAKRTLVQEIKDAYTASSDAIQNKTDQLFIDPLSSNPQISGNFDGFNDLRESVNDGRVEMGTILENWQKMIARLNTASYTQADLNLSKEYLSEVTNFISDLSRAVNMFEVTSYMSQATIDSYKADMLSARDSLNQASQGFIDAESSLAQTLSDVPVQLARVESAKASVSNLRFQLAKTALISPISGIVSKQDAKLGQTVSVGQSLVTVISGDFVVETFVPEVSFAGISRGNPAKITLDAYGTNEVFEAKVSHIDPAETIRDGVSTYKVELLFVSSDERIRSGMTANVEIETLRKTGTTLIPERTVLREEEGTFVYVLIGEKTEKTQVTLGEKDSRGNIEVLSGLDFLDKIILNPEK